MKFKKIILIPLFLSSFLFPYGKRVIASSQNLINCAFNYAINYPKDKEVKNINDCRTVWNFNSNSFEYKENMFVNIIEYKQGGYKEILILDKQYNLFPDYHGYAYLSYSCDGFDFSSISTNKLKEFLKTKFSDEGSFARHCISDTYAFKVRSNDTFFKKMNKEEDSDANSSGDWYSQANFTFHGERYNIDISAY